MPLDGVITTMTASATCSAAIASPSKLRAPGCIQRVDRRLIPGAAKELVLTLAVVHLFRFEVRHGRALRHRAQSRNGAGSRGSLQPGTSSPPLGWR